MCGYVPASEVILKRSVLTRCAGPETQTPGADDSAACEAYDADLYELLGVPREV